MTSSTRFCLFPLVAAVALLASSTAGVAADVGWTAPVGESSPAASIWLNDTTGATTFSQGILQLNGSADGLAITGQGGATNTGIMSLSGPTAVTRTSTTTGTQSLNFGTITGAGDWQINGSGKLVVNAQIADTLSDASQITKTGAGSLLITQANTYSGGTTLSEGTLIAGNSRAFSSGAIALNGGTFASVDDGSGGPRTFANAITVGNSMTFGDAANTGAVGFSSSVDLQGAVRTFTTSASVTFDGIVSNGGINKVGAASLTMTGINTYAGGTTLTEGTLFAGSNSALGTGDVTLGGSTSPTISSDASGAGSARTFANNVTIKGDVTFGNVSDSGALLFASSAKLGDTGENRAFTVNANTSFGGSISGGAGLTKYGEGTLTLSGSNSYSGGTTFAAGMIRAGNDNAFGTGALTFAGGAIGSADSTSHTFANSVDFLGDMTIGDYIDSMGALTFTSGIDLGNDNRRITTKSNGTFTGVIANGGITKDGLGTLTLSGSNTYSNGTTLLEGTLLAANDSAFGTGVLNLVGGVIGSESGRRTFGNNITMSAGALQFGDADHRDALTFVGLTALDSGEHRWNIVANTDFTGVISGQGASIVKDGDGVLTLANFNSYDGGTNLLAGTVRIANDASLGSGLITFGGGTLASATSDTRTITNNVAFTGNATIGDSASGGSVVFSGAQNNLGNTTRTITSNVATVFSNGLSGSGGLIKSGVGSLTLQGASTYTGDTRVDAGKLVLDGTLASKVVTVGAGAVFGGHGRFDGVISGAGSVDPGNSPGILTVAQVDARSAGSTSFNFEFTQTGAPTWSNAAASGNDVLRITDTVTPFVYALDQSNTVNLYFNASVTSSFTATNYVTLQGGFFTDKSDSNSLASAIAGANFQYYFESSTGSVVYNGHTYSTQAEARSNGLLPSIGQLFSVSTVRVPLANFDGANAFSNYGWSMRVISRGLMTATAVPEPSTWAMAAMAVGVATFTKRRRLVKLLARVLPTIGR